MHNQNVVPAPTAAAVITTRKSYTVTQPREYLLLKEILKWHINAKDDDGGDIREFNRLIALYEGTVNSKEASDYCLAFRDAWLADRSFSKISDEQRERCLETFRQLQKGIIMNWKTEDYSWEGVMALTEVSTLTKASYYLYTKLLQSDLGSEDDRYEPRELYESSDGRRYMFTFDDGSAAIVDPDDKLTVFAQPSCDISHLFEDLAQ